MSQSNKRMKILPVISVGLAAQTLFGSLVYAQGQKTVGELLNQAYQESRGSNSQIVKKKTEIPQSSYQFQPQETKNKLDSVKPPKAPSYFAKDDSLSSQYEAALDEQINELYKVTKRFVTSPNRGELWVRLAGLYSEKANLISNRKQDEFDKKIRVYNANPKATNKPVLDLSEAVVWNKKAVELYEWFVRDFPKDPKIPQAYFFLGYNYFEMANYEKGLSFYQKIVNEYPESDSALEARFSIGEYYFENEKFADALKQYGAFNDRKGHALYTFALYRSAWCYFRTDRQKDGLDLLEKVIKIERSEANRKKSARFKIADEATRNLVVFYAETGLPKDAPAYFQNLVGDDSPKFLEQLAYQYHDRGYLERSRDMFHYLIKRDPTAEKAFEYQYQIVRNYFYAKDVARFKEEMFSLIKDYGEGSAWYTRNSGNAEVVANAVKLREITLKNYVLQQHQTAQNSRAEFSQGLAHDGYLLYLKEFPNSESAGDMHFFFGELLYDMGKFEKAADEYSLIIEKYPQSKHAGKSAQNLILAAEKSLPPDDMVLKKANRSLDPVPYDEKSEKFLKVSKWYLEKYPNTDKEVEIKFRMARIYYIHNSFDQAIPLFKEIVQKYPKTKYAEYSANLLLDTYNLKKDYASLEREGNDLLKTGLAGSDAAKDIKNVVEKAAFKRAQDLEGEKQFAKSAKAFEDYAKKNTKSELAVVALFNSGVNYEKADQDSDALRMYEQVMASNEPKAQSLKQKTHRLIPRLYARQGKYEKAAEAYEAAGKSNKASPDSASLLYNAAILNQALGRNNAAINSYNEFLVVNRAPADQADALFSTATLYRKSGNLANAKSRYLEFLKTGQGKADQIIEAQYYLGQIAEKVGDKGLAQKYWNDMVGSYRRSKGQVTPSGAKYVALVKYEELKKDLSAYISIRLPADPKLQKTVNDDKINRLLGISQKINNLVLIESPEHIVNGLIVLGDANFDMYSTLVKAPLPKGLTPEETTRYKAGIEGLARPFFDKGMEGYKAGVAKARELQAYTPEYMKALKFMATQDPQAYPDSGVAGMDVRLVNWVVK